MVYTSVETLYEKFQQHPHISTDTRTLPPGALFFALNGARFNGNRYAADGPYLYVPDVLTALQQLATYHRQRLGTPIIAITGSNGKTTTKELLAAALALQYRVQATPGNFNNHIGVPLTLLGLRADTQLAVLELGDNHSGEIAHLCQIAQPNYGLITNIGKDHLEGFGSMEANIRAKAELFDFLAESHGTAFVPQADAVLCELAAHLPTVEWIADTQPPHLQALSPFLVLTDGTDAPPFSTQLTGAYNLENLRAVWCIAQFFGISPENLRAALQAYTPQNNRSQVVETEKNLLLMDAYNANPSSVMAALSSFLQLPTDRPKAVILGDMFELGNISDEEHRAIVQRVVAMPFALKLFCGTLYAAHRCEGATFYQDKETLARALAADPLEGHAILLKASRGIALETLLPYL